MNLATELEAAGHDAQWMRFLVTGADGDDRCQGFFDREGNPAKEIAEDVIRTLNRTSRLLKAQSVNWGPAAKRKRSVA